MNNFHVCEQFLYYVNTFYIMNIVKFCEHFLKICVQFIQICKYFMRMWTLFWFYEHFPNFEYFLNSFLFTKSCRTFQISEQKNAKNFWNFEKYKKYFVKNLKKEYRKTPVKKTIEKVGSETFSKIPKTIFAVERSYRSWAGSWWHRLPAACAYNMREFS